MRAKAGSVGATAKVWENPLVPHRRLREMYGAMLGARLLDEWLASQARPGNRRRRSTASTRGEEACRVSTVIGLERGDLVLDPTPSPITNYLLGAPGASVAKAFRGEETVAFKSGRKGGRVELGTGPVLGGAASLRIALGVALALKAQGRQRVLLSVAAAGEAGAGEWAEILAAAARMSVPMIFLALPGPVKAGILSARASRMGVPGIAVEADDAVALFRVAQESMVRIRMGGGPVLMECVRLPAKVRDRVDPVEAMRQVLLTKGAADEAWIDREAARLGTRLLAQLERGRP